MLSLKNFDISVILLLGGVTRILFLDQTRRNLVQCFLTGTGWAQRQGLPEILETSGHNGWYQMVKKILQTALQQGVWSQRSWEFTIAVFRSCFSDLYQWVCIASKKFPHFFIDIHHEQMLNADELCL